MNLNVFNTVAFLQTAGYLGLFIIVCAETSVFIGFFLPGDSLLFSAGLLSSLGYFDISLILLLAFIAAIIGDNIGYYVGKKYGTKIFYKEHSLFLNKQYIGQAEDFYRRHGGKTLVIARFLPVVRTAAPVLAGVGRMRYPIFFAYNVLGALIWSLTMSLFGFYLGKFIPHAERYLALILVGIVVISLAPAAVAILKDKDRRRRLWSRFK
ncbi:MAG: VTT domain-containing protein [Patescibacteria group bacterium]|nr:VTT domain-containing protein [Patescibacteria group bacterium]